MLDAVVAAGFTPETFDLSDKFGRVDWRDLADRLGEDHHAIVIPHLFGVPMDFRPMRQVAASRGVLVIEDCAHTLGGKIGEERAGTLGDAAIFSFNYDKPISMGGGGALLINRPELVGAISASPLSLQEERLELRQFVRNIRERRFQMGRASLAERLRRRLLPRATPELTPAKGFGPLRAALGNWQLERFAAVSHKRSANATALLDVPGWRHWHIDDDVTPAWLRMKLIPSNPLDVQAAVRPLHTAGLRVGGYNWPQTLDELRSHPVRPHAQYVASYGLDAPIHQEMRASELRLIASTLAGAAQRACKQASPLTSSSDEQTVLVG